MLCISALTGCGTQSVSETDSPSQSASVSEPAATPTEAPVFEYDYENGVAFDNNAGLSISTNEAMLANTVRDYGVALRDDEDSIYLVQRWHISNYTGDNITANSVIKAQAEFNGRAYANVQYFYDDDILLYLNPTIEDGTECDIYSMLTIPADSVSETADDPITEFIITIGTDYYRIELDKITDYHTLQTLVCEIASAMPTNISTLKNALEYTWSSGIDYRPDQTRSDMQSFGQEHHSLFSGWISSLNAERDNFGRYESGCELLIEVLTEYDNIYSMLADNQLDSEEDYTLLLSTLTSAVTEAEINAESAFETINANMPFAEFKLM